MSAWWSGLGYGMGIAVIIAAIAARERFRRRSIEIRADAYRFACGRMLCVMREVAAEPECYTHGRTYLSNMAERTDSYLREVEAIAERTS